MMIMLMMMDFTSPFSQNHIFRGLSVPVPGTATVTLTETECAAKKELQNLELMATKFISSTYCVVRQLVTLLPLEDSMMCSNPLMMMMNFTSLFSQNHICRGFPERRP